MAAEIPWQAIGAVATGALATFSAIYGIVTSNRSKQTELKLRETQDDFEREKTRRQNWVADIERCETRLDQQEAALKKWMTDYAELNAKYLAECQAHAETRQSHNETRLEVATLKHRVDEIEAEKKSLERERDAIKSEYEAYQRLVKNTAVGTTVGA